jgi:hypothetical protein
MVPEGDQVGTERQLAIAASAGFDVIDLSDVYEGSDRESLWVAEWDAHPNARGHALVGSRLYQRLREKPHLLTAPPPDTTRKLDNAVAGR